MKTITDSRDGNIATVTNFATSIVNHNILANCNPSSTLSSKNVAYSYSPPPLSRSLLLNSARMFSLCFSAQAFTTDLASSLLSRLFFLSLMLDTCVLFLRYAETMLNSLTSTVTFVCSVVKKHVQLNTI